MSVFKCKMCGGTIEFSPEDTVGVCGSCGTKQTLPRLNDDKRANLYDRANHFRRNNEFDKAMAIYEQILLEDNTDAEAYWSLVLCRYGIEYVEDPVNHKRVPTVNRAQFVSIFADEDYKSALQYADGYQKEIYKQEAKDIDEIQKGILEISSKEAPFDVFICYKETDNSGRRTQDSVLATDLYHQLTQEGFKVFFSRITLEDKLGTAYEPYIFAALNSAKIMVVIGTKPEYFNAVWVKNEWSRYLALVKQSNGKKMLIPAYRDMDPYDLPEEFSHLQAQDMSKLGFMQDLIRGIKKLLDKDSSKSSVREKVIVENGDSSVEPLLKRAFIFLSDGNFKEADAYCEKVLDQQPECAQAYLGKLMAELQVPIQERLSDCTEPFDDNINYKNILKFGDEKICSALKNYVSDIIYTKAKQKMDVSKTEKEYIEAAKLFEKADGYRDAELFRKQCLEQAEIQRKDTIYESAKANMGKNRIEKYESAIKGFQSISEWKDSKEQIRVCEDRIEKLKQKENRQRKNRKKFVMIAASIISIVFIGIILLDGIVIPKMKLDKAMELIDKEKYKEAYALLEELGDTDKILSNKYDRAMKLIDEKNYVAAYKLLDGLYYKDSEQKLEEIKPLYQSDFVSKIKVGATITFGTYEQDNNLENGKEDIEWIVLEKDDKKALLLSKYALDAQPYNIGEENVTWETCSIRTWLNAKFLNDAFTATEQKKIIISIVTADENPEWDTSSGDETIDRVFLLSLSESEKYFASDELRECVPTEYAIEQGVYTDARAVAGGKETCEWWLRSTGDEQTRVSVVDNTGEPYPEGFTVNMSGPGVRPALWIDISF